MPLQTIQLENFRSYERRVFALDPGITLVVGPNASGKTNLLEGVYVLATTRSFRAKDVDLVRHEQDYFRLVGQTDEMELSLGFGQQESGARVKRVMHDSVKRSLVAHIGALSAVLFEPNDLSLLVGPPDGRRRYLDTILCQTDPAYMTALTTYRRVLKQRNSLLDRFATDAIKDQIFAWDVKLASTAGTIVEARKELITYLNNLIPDLYGRIAGTEQSFRLRYEPSVDGVDYGSSFLEALDTNLFRDLAAGFTTVGPHREDFSVKFKDSRMSTLASRGEVRTAVLALKLAEILYMEQQTGRKPILLLDDVFSELDKSRRTLLLTQLVGYQTIITTTDADHVRVDLPKNFTLIDMEVEGGR